MKIRRYYNRNVQYEHRFFPKAHGVDEYTKLMVQHFGVSEERALQMDTAEHEIVLETEEEEASWFFDCLDRVLQNPGWYLDNLDHCPTFTVHIEKIFPTPVSGPGLGRYKRNKKVFKSRTL